MLVLAAAVAGCASAPREPVALVNPDYGVSIQLEDTRWHLDGNRSFDHDEWGRYHWIEIVDRTAAANVQVSLQHSAEVPADLQDLTSWSAAVFDLYLDLYVGTYGYQQRDETTGETVTLASGQQVALEFRTYVINGHVRNVATATFEDHGVRGFVWIANWGLTAPLDALAPEILQGIALDAPAPT